MDVLNTSQPNPDPGSYAYITIPGQADDMAVWDNGDNTWRNIGQNNTGKPLLLFLQPGTSFNISTGVQLLNNGGPFSSMTTVSFPIIISEKESPVIFIFGETLDGITKKYIYVFHGGKGSWANNGTLVDTSQFTLIDIQGVTVDDIPEDFTTELGEIPEGGFILAMNSEERNLMDNTRPYYFSYYTGNELYYALFTGDPGIYGGGSVFQFNEDQFAIVTDGSASEGITRTDQLENTGEGSSPFTTVASLNGLTLESNQAAAELYLKNAEGEIISTINVAFLNNEGTTFFYNESTQMLELKNDAGEILSTVPVNAFVANLMQSVSFNGATPYILEFKDAEGAVVDSVSFSVSNIQGLQALLDSKVSYSDMDSTPTLLSENGVKSNGIYTMIRRHVISTEVDLNNYNEAGDFLTPSSGLLNLPSGFAQTRYTLTVNSAQAVYGSQILVSCGYDNQIAIRRRSGSSWGQWFIVWTYGNFTQSDVNNWNTAFGWGNHTGLYLPLGADIPTEADLNTYLQTGIFTQRFNFQAAAGTNYPVPLKGFLEVLRTPEGLISQKYHVTGGDENNYYIRIYGNSWSGWKKLLSNVDITDSNIANWNIVKVSADYTNPTSSVGYGGGNSINDLPKGTYTAILSTNIADQPFTSVGGFISIGATGVGQGTQILGSRTGNELWFRPYSNTYGSWYRLWNSGDFSQSEVNNWNTAFGWGDFRDYGLGVSNTLLYPQSDLNNINVPNGFYTVPNTILNIPTNSGGALTLERYAGYITQKYQAVNAGDVVRLFIRHYKTAAASWTPWREIWTDENLTTDNIAQWDEAYTHSDSSGNPHNTQISDIQNLQDELNNLQSQLDNLANGGKKVYKAVITGADINDPVVDVLQNDFSGTIVWTRTNAGSYTATLTGAFTEKKTHVQCTGYMDGYNLLASGGRTGIDTVNVRTTRQANPSAAYYFWNYDIPSTAFVNVTIEVFD
ncbi:pyocin knob domain-containing protein [Flavobacterium beibuense]|uniref:pyocin knob domain-containing protein n=1 Tax=Flavobacterium beibuense TaxID=657326 RepID=UPI003A94F1A9